MTLAMFAQLVIYGAMILLFLAPAIVPDEWCDSKELLIVGGLVLFAISIFNLVLILSGF